MNRRRLLVMWLGVAALSACASPQRDAQVGPDTPNRYGGTAVRVFAIPYYDVRSAVIGMFHYTAIRLDALQPLGHGDGEYVRGARGDLKVQIILVRRGASDTDVRVDAWRSAVFGDTAAAEAILGTLERRLGLNVR